MTRGIPTTEFFWEFRFVLRTKPCTPLLRSDMLWFLKNTHAHARQAANDPILHDTRWGSGGCWFPLLVMHAAFLAIHHRPTLWRCLHLQERALSSNLIYLHSLIALAQNGAACINHYKKSSTVFRPIPSARWLPVTCIAHAARKKNSFTKYHQHGKDHLVSRSLRHVSCSLVVYNSSITKFSLYESQIGDNVSITRCNRHFVVGDRTLSS